MSNAASNPADVRNGGNSPRSASSKRRPRRAAAADRPSDRAADQPRRNDDSLVTEFEVDGAESETAVRHVPATTSAPRGHRGPRTGSPVLPYDEIPIEFAEALRAIINRRELRAGSPLPKTIAVTSALAGEGATTASQAMATLIAQEMNKFVCWVDCSWLSADAVQASPDRPSLIDILADQSRVDEAFQSPSGLPNLLSLCPGPVPDSRRNMIVRSPEFDRLLDVLTDEFDHIIFDLPPVLSNANALALIRRADASLLVARHRSTTLAQVERAIEAMHPTPNLGVLVNQFRSSIPYRLRRLLGE